MMFRYPMHIEKELKGVIELIELNDELMLDEPDEALKYNLKFLQGFKKELTEELNQSYEHYKISSFDAIIEGNRNNKIPSLPEVTRFLSNLQEILYSLAESAWTKVMKGTKISEVVFEGTTLGIKDARKGSLIIQLKPINTSQSSLNPYLKIATDKLNDLLDCGSDEELIREQAKHLGSQPIFKYKKMLEDIKTDDLTIKLFNEIKPQDYETQIITPKFASDVFAAINQAEPNENYKYEFIEGDLKIINGKQNKITISSKIDDKKTKDFIIAFDNDRFASVIGKNYDQFVKVKVKYTTKFYELEEETKEEIELIRFL